MKKNILTGLLLGAFSVFGANASTLNDVPDEKGNVLKDEILDMFADGGTSLATIESLKQVDETDNYLFKYKENGEFYTMMYIGSIKSLYIQSTGEVYSLVDKTFLTKDFNSSFIKKYLKDIDLSEIITYESFSEEKGDDIYVFTDTTCGYCQKLHREITEYQNQNMDIHYLPFPRSGLSGFGYNQWVNTLCAADRKAAMTTAKTIQAPIERNTEATPEEFASCRATVGKYYQLGLQMGVKGTPAIFSENGTQLGGYVPAHQLRSSLTQDLIK